MACAFAAASAVGGCEGRRASVEDASSTIATVSGRPLTVAEFKAAAGSGGTTSSHDHHRVERINSLVGLMVRNELLRQEAERRKVADDPEIKSLIDRILVQRLLRKVAEEVAARPVSDTEVHSYYTLHERDFARPARSRLAHLFLASPAGDPRRSHAHSRARQFVTELRREAKPNRERGFAALVGKHSDDLESREAGGDLGFLTEEELGLSWGRHAARAAFSISQPGEFSDVIEGDRGIHIFRLLHRDEMAPRNLEEARPEIVKRIKASRESAAIEDFVASLRKQASIEVNKDALRMLNSFE